MPWRLLMIVNGSQLRPSDREEVEDVQTTKPPLIGCDVAQAEIDQLNAD